MLTLNVHLAGLSLSGVLLRANKVFVCQVLCIVNHGRAFDDYIIDVDIDILSCLPLEDFVD